MRTVWVCGFHTGSHWAGGTHRMMSSEIPIVERDLCLSLSVLLSPVGGPTGESDKNCMNTSNFLCRFRGFAGHSGSDCLVWSMSPPLRRVNLSLTPTEHVVCARLCSECFISRYLSLHRNPRGRCLMIPTIQVGK